MQTTLDLSMASPVKHKNDIQSDAGRKVLLNTFGTNIDNKEVQTLHDAAGTVISGPMQFNHKVKSRKKLDKKGNSLTCDNVTNPYWLIRLDEWEGKPQHLYSGEEFKFLD